MSEYIKSKPLWDEIRSAEKGSVGGWIDGPEFDRWVSAVNRALTWAVENKVPVALVEGSLQGRHNKSSWTHVVCRNGAVEVFRSSAEQGLVHNYVRISLVKDHPIRRENPPHGKGLTVGAPFAYYFKGVSEDVDQQHLEQRKSFR
jgi:hypothetical protein